MAAATDIMEGFPDHIVEKIQSRDKQRGQMLPAYINGIGLNLVLEDLKLWQAGVLTVSFKGGTSALHKKIADAANEWTKYGNISFDFGYDSSTQLFRQWKPADDSHIRVGFEYDGYWSLVGTDSKDPKIVPDGGISLNLSQFDRQLPRNWAGTVLHEFGHALGFQHEQQSPDAKCDFDWDKVYLHLKEPPNNWEPEKVDRNLRPLPTRGFTFSTHDKASIMHYALPSWMFKSGEASPCFTARSNVLSPTDKKMMGEAYPASSAMIENVANMRIENLETILHSYEPKHDLIRAHFDNHLQFLKKEQQSLQIFN